VVVKPVVVRETGEGFDTIGEAITAASPGHHIDVSAGNYEENLVIYKQLFLVGGNKDTTVIDGGGIGDAVRFVSISDGSGISGFTIRNFGNSATGVYCEDSASVTILDNIVNGEGITDSSGIIIINSSSSVASCILENSANNIRCLGGTPYIGGNTIRDGDYGIVCDDALAVIELNIISGNEYGIHIDGFSPDIGGGGSSLGNNDIRDNTSWDLFNNSPNEVRAEKNLWDHTKVKQIDGLDVYDDDENPSCGKVDFIPFKKKALASSIRIKPQFFAVYYLFKDFLRGFLHGDLPASVVYISPSLKVKLHITCTELNRARSRSLTDERYYTLLMMRASR
jgi:hypothetical protein